MAETSAWHKTFQISDAGRGLIYLSRRTSLRLTADPSDREMVMEAVVPLPLLAHQVYGDFRLWWAILDVNRITQVFQAFFRGLPAGTKYRIPTAARVQAAMELET